MRVGCVTFTAVLLLLISKSNAAIQVGTKQYAVQYDAGTIATSVPILYQGGKRPASVSEWKTIWVSAGSGNLVGSLDALGSTAVLWDDSKGKFVTVNLASPADPPLPVDTTASNPGIVVLTNAHVSCTVGTSAMVNILDSYPNITIQDTVVDSCLCFSQYSGVTCDTLSTALCDNTLVTANTANTGQQVVRNGTNGGRVNPLMETVEFTIDSPQVATRNYTSFSWGTCKSGGLLTNTALRLYQSASDAESCQDSFRFGWMVSQLVSVCGLQEGNFAYDGTTQGMANNSWVRYRGDLMIYYAETVTLSVNNGTAFAYLTRTGRLVTPIDLYLLLTYRVHHPNEDNPDYQPPPNGTVEVTSDFELKAAISATSIKANQTTSTVDITFGISKPYDIVWISNTYLPNGGIDQIPGVQWESLNGAPDIAGAFVVNFNGDPIMGSSVIHQDSEAGLAPCTSTDYDVNGFCWRTIRVLIIMDSACTLNHRFTFNTVAVACSAEYLATDCPLPTINTTSQASFVIKSADFCDGQRALVIDGAIVLKAYVPQRTLSRTDTTPLRSYALNDQAWLTLFIDAERSLRVFQLTGQKFETKLGDSGSYTVPKQAATYLTDTNAGHAGWDDYAQGFDIATQTYAMAVTFDCNFVMAADGQTCLLNPGGNENVVSQQVYARLTFNVDYENSQTGLRRRRQANALRGYAAMALEMGISSDVALVEATPSTAHEVHSPGWLWLLCATALTLLLR